MEDVSRLTRGYREPKSGCKSSPRWESNPRRTASGAAVLSAELRGRRCYPESNRGARGCNPLPRLSAIAPRSPSPRSHPGAFTSIRVRTRAWSPLGHSTMGGVAGSRTPVLRTSELVEIRLCHCARWPGPAGLLAEAYHSVDIRGTETPWLLLLPGSASRAYPLPEG